jgi:hypothetical protein
LVLTLLRQVAALFLGGVILWQVVERCGSHSGQVIIHVAMPPACVVVDGADYDVADLWESPVACDLRPGRHQVRMLRNGRVVYREEFTLGAGEERILTAWDGYTDGRSPRPAD